MQKLYSKKKTTVIIDYLQLIKYIEKATHNRSLEIANITRELKLLAKHIKSPLIVLSQLNRNIENRINQRPLLSDLRESGCLSYENLPNIQKNIFGNCIENLNCFKSFYILNKKNTLRIYQTKSQYIYYIQSYNRTLLYLTHNHKILLHSKWKKEDQVQDNNLNNTILKNNINDKFIIELNTIKNIKKLIKNKVYDIVAKEYQNFIVNKYIVHNSIEQDADLILMLYKNKDNIDKKIIEIVIAKHRTGSIGSFQLLFHKDTGKFEDINNNNLKYID